MYNYGAYRSLIMFKQRTMLQTVITVTIAVHRYSRLECIEEAIRHSMDFVECVCYCVLI